MNMVIVTVGTSLRCNNIYNYHHIFFISFLFQSSDIKRNSRKQISGSKKSEQSYNYDIDSDSDIERLVLCCRLTVLHFKSTSIIFPSPILVDNVL